jgi:hypothetical protein
MNREKLQLAHQIIDEYCEKNKFDRSYFDKKCQKRPVKIYKKVKVFKHRQVISLYLNTVLGVEMQRIGPMIGYKDHTTVSNNVKKFKFLLKEGDVEINNLWNNMASWANEMIKQKYEKSINTSNLQPEVCD